MGRPVLPDTCPPANSFVGRTYDRLKVMAFVGRDRNRDTLWDCECICGGTARVTGASLRKAQTRSCGCLQRETAARITGARSVTHGEARHSKRAPEYGVWVQMRRRCREHPNYAGRGITVCERWDTSYEAFLADMGRRPSRRHSIERLNNDLGYQPGNCIWATPKTQARNRRDNRLSMGEAREMRRLHGEGVPIGDVARDLGRRYQTVWLVVRGKIWVEERAS